MQGSGRTDWSILFLILERGRANEVGGEKSFVFWREPLESPVVRAVALCRSRPKLETLRLRDFRNFLSPNEKHAVRISSETPTAKSRCGSSQFVKRASAGGEEESRRFCLFSSHVATSPNDRSKATKVKICDQSQVAFRLSPAFQRGAEPFESSPTAPVRIGLTKFMVLLGDILEY